MGKLVRLTSDSEMLLLKVPPDNVTGMILPSSSPSVKVADIVSNSASTIGVKCTCPAPDIGVEISANCELSILRLISISES